MKSINQEKGITENVWNPLVLEEKIDRYGGYEKNNNFLFKEIIRYVTYFGLIK